MTRPVLLAFAFILSAVGLIWTSQASALQNDEDIVVQSFEVEPFDAVRLRGAGDVTIEIADTTSVELSTHRRVAGFFDVSVEDGKLTAGFPAALVFDATGLAPITWHITTPTLSSLEIDGPLRVTIDGLETPALDLRLSTAAELTLNGLDATTLTADLGLASSASVSGRVERQQISAANASSWDAANLDSAQAEVDLSQAATATIRVGESISGSVATAATLNYIGEDVSVDVDTSLLGSVIQIEGDPLPATPESVATPVSLAAPMEVTIEIREFAFQPEAVEVAAGGTVTWTNQDSLSHDVAQLPPGSGFASSPLPKGATFSVTFEEPGLVEYYCPSHPLMYGTITVVDD
jgi:plastocyanin